MFFHCCRCNCGLVFGSCLFPALCEAVSPDMLIQKVDGGKSAADAFYVEYPDASGAPSTEGMEMVVEALQTLERKLETMETNTARKLETMETNTARRLETLETNTERRLETLETNTERRLEMLETNIQVLAQTSAANFRILPVPEDLETSLRDGSTWSKNVKAHYGQKCCTVLSQVFPQTHASWWFPAVSEHIVPKGQWQVASKLGFEVSNSRNGLLLLKHLEKTYQAGKWTLIPTGNHAKGVELKIYVSNDLKTKSIQYEDGKAVCGKCHRKDKPRPLTFDDLHEKTISVNPAPFMRSLYLKAEMAHGEHNELPNPRDFTQNYEKRCDAMKAVLLQRLLQSKPDQALPVVQ